MGDFVVVIARTTGTGAFQLTDRVGVVRPAHSTALGKIILASLRPDQLKRFLERVELKPSTRKSITDPTTLLREIAETLSLHESTISRVTTQKYMATPRGTFELKYFFGSHVATDAGGAASSTAIRALIKQLVAAENAQSPLSDARIAQLLLEQGGIKVARRTIAKYRDSLQIPAVNQRKAL